MSLARLINYFDNSNNNKNPPQIDNEISLENFSENKSDNANEVYLFVYKPEVKFFGFYSDNFDNRLQLLKDHILQANAYLKAKDDTKQAKSLFAAPEYLFKNFSPTNYSFYTKKQKNKYKKELKEISKKVDMIIAPGTICWFSEKMFSHKKTHRNIMYFFYKGKIVFKYKKSHLAEGFDYPHWYNNLPYKTGTHDPAVKEINGLNIGVEICLDSAYASLATERKHEHKDKKLDIQLLVADKMRDPIKVPQNGLMFFHVELSDDNEIGIIQENKQTNEFELQETKVDEQITSELACYKLKK